MQNRVLNVLFLCTGNSARSILAESILRKDGNGRFRSFSAGSMPNGSVNPLALETLSARGYPTESLRSKSWQEFDGPDAPVMDFVFTVCDSAAGESCPIWPGHPMTAHWGVEDPSHIGGTDADKQLAFAHAFRFLQNRVIAFAALPLDRLDTLTLRSSLRAIGLTEGASTGAEAKS